jgi:hypothetical protein
MATLLKSSGTTNMHTDPHASSSDDDWAVLTLDANGMIRNCNKAAGKLMECATSKLVWQHVSNLLPQLAETALMQDGHVNPRLRFLSRVGHRFEFATPSGKHGSGRIFFNDLENAGRHNVRIIICPDERPDMPS